jgi:V/A-type H+-transporting ATPase subunit F
MYKIAALGDRDSVLGFRALGLDTRFADTPDEASAILQELAKGDAAVIYITERLAAPLAAEIAKYKDSVVPAIIVIPGQEGSMGLGMESLRSAVERAVGANILET